MPQPTLSDATRINAFVSGCTNIYKNWQKLTPAIRRSKICEQVRLATRSISLPDLSFSFKPMQRDGGHLLQQSWCLEIDTGVSERHQVGVDEMLWFCSILYHESRHAEQWYRCVQGVLAADFRPSKNSVKSVSLGNSIADVRSNLRSVNDRVLADPKKLSTASIAERMMMPLSVVQHAEARGKNAYRLYAKELPIANWFNSIWGSGRRNRGQVLRHPEIQVVNSIANQRYHALPEEADAFDTQYALERSLRIRLQGVNQTNVQASRGVQNLRNRFGG
jgi:hypothetical protein